MPAFDQQGRHQRRHLGMLRTSGAVFVRAANVRMAAPAAPTAAQAHAARHAARQGREGQSRGKDGVHEGRRLRAGAMRTRCACAAPLVALPDLSPQAPSPSEPRNDDLSAPMRSYTSNERIISHTGDRVPRVIEWHRCEMAMSVGLCQRSSETNHSADWCEMLGCMSSSLTRMRFRSP